MWIMWSGDYSAKVQWTVTLVVALTWIGFASAARERVIRPIQTIGNMIAGLREGDFSIRARGATPTDDLGLALLELNTLGETLRQQRLGALEATTLLRRVMEEIDVAVFAFDEGNRVQLVNPAGARLLGRPLERLHNRSASELGLAPFLEGESTGVRDAVFAGRTGRFGLRRGEFRQGGKPHRLLVLADLSRALRDEERQAWQRLVRVLGHEVNNSLAPIKSVAQSLQMRVKASGQTADEDVERGLDLIASRSEALARLMGAYARLARLPAPKRAPLHVETWVRRVAGLETRLPVAVMTGPNCTIQADGDQLDQLLINLVTNAVDAALQAHGSFVEVGWTQANNHLDVTVRDDGPGLPQSGNLFVPFFTTKPSGSGIGLALSRQIAESHGGSLTLANREDGQGCVATLRLPMEE